MTLGETVKELRLSRGLTQEELGAMIGVEQPAISALERDAEKASEAHAQAIFQVLEEPVPTMVDNETPTFAQDEPPAIKPAKAKRTRKKAPAKSAGLPLSVQLQFPYQLLANATATQLPTTSGVLLQQAQPCAEAWDQFLMRYPAFREKLEQGMVATDIIALVMAHLPIIQCAREEMAARQSQQSGQAGYAGGIDGQAA